MSVPGSRLGSILARAMTEKLSTDVDRQIHGSSHPTRVPPLRRFTDAELAVIAGLAEGLTIPALAKRLGLAPTTVDWHAQNAAKAIPGDLLRRNKLIVWWRGASLDILCTKAQAVAYLLRLAGRAP